MIFDLEEIVRDYLTTFPVSLAPLLEHLENNLNFWRNYFQSPPVDSPDYFDNLAVTAATLEDIAILVQGGMQGIDGMHPTTIGYCELAIELIRLYKPDFRPKQLLKQALHHESLITKPPIGLGLLVALIRLARHIPRDAVGRPIHAEHRNVIMELATVIELLSGIMKRGR